MRDNIPTLSEWLNTLPVWKRHAFLLMYQTPFLWSIAILLFGYDKARRNPLLPRDAILEE